jgi:hypothetical protein
MKDRNCLIGFPLCRAEPKVQPLLGRIPSPGRAKRQRFPVILSPISLRACLKTPIFTVAADARRLKLPGLLETPRLGARASSRRLLLFKQALRAWRAWKATHETEEAPNCPAARTARAKRVGHFNDKEKWPKQSGESDQLVVGHNGVGPAY